MALASTGYIILGYEELDTPGVARGRTSANYQAFPAEEVEIDPAKEFIDFKEIRGSRQASITLDGPFRPTANMKGALYPVGVTGMLLAGTFGAVSSTASGGVTTHVFSDSAALPTFTLERADAQTDAQIVQQAKGCKIESLQLACAFGEKADLTVNFQVQKKPEILEETFNEVQTPAITKIPLSMLPYKSDNTTPVEPVTFKGATVKWSSYGTDGLNANTSWDNMTALATIKSVNVEFNNTLTRQETLNGADDAYKIFEGGMECTLSGTVVFEDLTMYNKMMSGLPVAIRLKLESNTEVVSGTKHSIEFYWPRVKVSKASLPFTAGEVIESDVEFKVIFDQSEGKLVEITMKNDDSDTAYNIPA